MENNEGDVDGLIKKDRKDKSKFKSNSYKCQFCEKSFPRLGYLKKHEQVSELFIILPLNRCQFSLVTYLNYRRGDIVQSYSNKLVIIIFLLSQRTLEKFTWGIYKYAPHLPIHVILLF